MRQKIQTFAGIIIALLLGNFSLNAQYCIPTYDITGYCTAGDNINTFQLFNSGINHLNTGCSTDGYGDYTADLGLVGNLQASVVYNFHITHDYDYNQNVKIYIDFNNDQAFNETDELLYTSPVPTSDVDFTDGSITIPAIAPVNGLRMRVMNAYNGIPTSCGYTYYGETHDYTVNILAPPTCVIPTNATVDAVMATNADISWGLIGNGIGYNIEWGLPGFTPGTGAEVGSEMGVVGSTYQITPLLPATDYQYYIQTDCDVTDGLSQWAGPISFTTPCVPISTLPWSENFDAMTSLDYELFPNCWEYEGYGVGTDDNTHYNTFNNADALSPENYVFFQYGSDSYLFTPEFELVAGETYEFEFAWAGDTHSGWFGEVVVSESQSSTDAEVIGDPFIEYGDATTFDYSNEKYCFTPTSNGNYSFGFHVMESDYWYYLNIDNVSLKQASPSVGTDATLTVCEQSGQVNLDDLGQITDFGGSWSFDDNPSALLNDNELNIDVIPNTTVVATYWANSCLAPDVIATITIVPSVSAGINGSITGICQNQPIDLLAGLSGAFNLGGQWYNSSNAAIPGSYINSGNLPGQFNFTYIVGNGGICPNDTASVVLNVSSCNYLAIDELSSTDFNVYPNPTMGEITIKGDFGTELVTYSVLDLNGKVIASSSNTQILNNEITVDLSDAMNGIYILKLTTATSENLFRIVKQ